MNLFYMHNIVVQYRHTQCLFPQIAIPEAGVTYIQGDNGSGKTTLLKVLAGLERPISGILYYKEHKVSKSLVHRLHKECTLLLQNAFLFDRSVYDNLVYPFQIDKRKYTKEDIVNAINDVGLECDILKKYPHELSGGERQRVALAVRLLVDSETILLDEPTANVDKLSVQQIQKIIENISAHKKVILVAHNSPWAEEIAGHIIEL